MSYVFADYVACPNLQEQLADHFLFNPQQAQDPIGALQFVTSDLNTNNTLQRQIAPGAGKLRAVELTFQPRFTDASSTSADISCNGGTEYGNTSQLYELDPSVGISRTFTITPAQLATMCEADDAWVAKQIQAHMDAMARQMNVELSSFIAASLGNFYGGGTNKVTSTKTSNGQFVEDLTADVVYEWQSIEWMMNQPFLIGDGLLNKYMRAMNAGCCALSGVDLGAFSAQNQLTFLRDKNIATALGDPNGFAVLGAGAVQMLRYNAFESPIMQIEDGQLKQGVLIDPKTGIPYDYYAKYDCGTWNFQLKLAYKYVKLPDDIYRTGDPLDGTNGILHFTITNP